MLIEFSVQNFKVFSQKQTLSMAAKKSYKEHPETTATAEHFDDLLINKVAVIYGANGAGKSSFVEALDFLQSYILRGFADSSQNDSIRTRFIDREIPKFIFDEEQLTAPTDFEISFIGTTGERYQYTLSIGTDAIEAEGLWVYSKKGVRPKTIISRVYNAETNEFEYYCPSLQIDKKTYEVAIEKANNSKRSPFVSILHAYDVSQLDEFINWFRGDLIVSSNRNDDVFRMASRYSFLDDLADGDEQKKNKILEFLNKFDLSISDISVTKKNVTLPDEMPEEMKKMILSDVGFQIVLEHTTSSGIKKNIPYERLSSGTKKLFDLSGILLLCCEAGEKSVLVLDEFESSLHPYIVRAIFELIVKHSERLLQLILTTHSNVLLDTEKLVRRDQIWFLEKNSELETVLYPLSDFAPRFEDSIIKGWDLGKFGGVPFLG